MITIEHIPAGGLSSDVVRDFLTESGLAYSQEVGSPDLVEWPAKLARFADCFCIRRQDGSLAAGLFAYLNDTVAHVGYVPFLCSLPECEKGTAYQLHEAFRNEAGRRGMTRLCLEVVKSNEHAHRFYLRQGYEVEEDRVERNRWLMSLTI